MSLIISVLSALILALMWMSFLKNINFYNREKWGAMLVAFLLGGISVVPVLFYEPIRFDILGDDMGFMVNIAVNVALVEELSKALFFLVAFKLLRHKFHEPASFVIFGSLVALGFASVENVLYFDQYGADIVFLRGIMSVFGHITYTSLFAYGLYTGLRSKGAYRWLIPLAGLLSGTFLHFTYDYFLMERTGPSLLTLCAIGIFLIGIELWATMFNNLINKSNYFRVDQVLDTLSMRRFITVMFVLTLLTKLTSSVMQHGGIGVSLFFTGLWMEIFLGYILFNRITRFVFIKDHHVKLRPDIPISFSSFEYDDELGSRGNIRIKGIEFDEYSYTRHMLKTIRVTPLSFKTSQIGDAAEIRLVNKHYIGHEMIIFEIKFEWADDPMPAEYHYYLVPKTGGKTHLKNFPIAGLMATDNPFESEAFEKEKPKFFGWLVIREPDEKKPLFQILKEAFRESDNTVRPEENFPSPEPQQLL